MAQVEQTRRASIFSEISRAPSVLEKIDDLQDKEETDLLQDLQNQTDGDLIQELHDQIVDIRQQVQTHIRQWELTLRILQEALDVTLILERTLCAFSEIEDEGRAWWERI
jgi:hypothetical protein